MRPYVHTGPARHRSRRLEYWQPVGVPPRLRPAYPATGPAYIDGYRVCGAAVAPMRHHDAGLSWTASGYGRKLPTRYMLAYADGRGGYRWHRVYVAQYGNAGSAYIIVRGRMTLLTPDVEHALETTRDAADRARRMREERLAREGTA